MREHECVNADTCRVGCVFNNVTGLGSLYKELEGVLLYAQKRAELYEWVLGKSQKFNFGSPCTDTKFSVRRTDLVWWELSMSSTNVCSTEFVQYMSNYITENKFNLIG